MKVSDAQKKLHETARIWSERLGPSPSETPEKMEEKLKANQWQSEISESVRVLLEALGQSSSVSAEIVDEMQLLMWRAQLDAAFKGAFYRFEPAVVIKHLVEAHSIVTTKY
jgi:hypothetical protein